MRKHLLVLALLTATHASAASAAALPCPPPGGDPAYQVSLRSLTGPAGADLTVRAGRAPGSGCAVPQTLKKVQVKIFALDGTLVSTRNLDDVTAADGTADLRLGKVARGQRVTTEVLIQNADETRTYVTRSGTRTLLRPDLVVNATTSPRVVFATRTFDVTANVTELNGDVGAAATVTLTDGQLALGTTTVAIDAGGTAEAHFQNVALADPGASDLALKVQDADPRETDVSNNTRRAAIDVITVANHSDDSQVTLGGYGAQMNQNLYASITGAPFSALADLESKVIAQQPGLVRVFYDDKQARQFPDRLESFYKTLQLAQRSGAMINVTLQSTATGQTLSATVGRFANVLNTAVRSRGVTDLRWVTIQNEPNSTALTPATLETWYRALDTQLRTLGIRTQIHFMGLDLVLTDQQTWFDYAAAHMSDLLDAYSIHVFWDYWDTAKLESRLQGVHDIVGALPASARKPVYSMEYGVRGIRSIGTTNFVDPGVWDATQQIPVTQTNVNAFQQAWFDVLAAQLGYAGTVKWDSYYSKYDSGSQAYFMLGHWDENGIWRVNPIYDVVRLFTAVTRPGWNVTTVEPDSLLDTRLAASYAGPDGRLTVVGLDRAGGQLNGVSTLLVPYAVGGLPASATFQLVEWNRDGDGRTAPAGTVTTDDAGVASFLVPQQAVFALTNA